MRPIDLAGAVVLCACASGPAAEGRTSSLVAGRRDDVVTIGAHNEITHVAATERVVFAATPRGIIAYDKLFRSWLLPLTDEAAFRVAATALAADPTDDAVWMGAPRVVVYYSPRLGAPSSAAVRGNPEEIFFDREDLGAGAYVRMGTQYIRVPRASHGLTIVGGEPPPPDRRLRSPTARDVFQAYPALESFLPLLTRSNDGEQWPVSAATLAPGRTEVWLGTRGNGLLLVDPIFNRAEPFPFGLLEPGVGALAVVPDGVWIGGLGASSERNGLVFASSDLQRWRWLDGPPSRPLAGARVHAVAIDKGTAWIGTSRGLLRMDLNEDNRTTRWDASDGLPSDIVTSVAVGGGRTWIGTTEGLAVLDRSPRAVGPRITIRDLLLWNDTLWIASDAGVLALGPQDSVPRRLSVDDARLTLRVEALARSDSVLAVATEFQLIEIDLKAAHVLPPRAPGEFRIVTRSLVRVAMDARTIWIAGERGVTAIHRATAQVVDWTVSVPLTTTALALTRDFVWVGTRDGLVRIRRRADGMLP